MPRRQFGVLDHDPCGALPTCDCPLSALGKLWSSATRRFFLECKLVSDVGIEKGTFGERSAQAFMYFRRDVQIPVTLSGLENNEQGLGCFVVMKVSNKR
jgi:hypothetical protein